MLNQQKETHINKVLEAFATNKIRQQKIDLSRKKPHLMGFKQFLQKRALSEMIMRQDIISSMMAILPQNAPQNDLSEVMSQIAELNRVGEISLIAVVKEPPDNAIVG
jgi:hypothetical protein